MKSVKKKSKKTKNYTSGELNRIVDSLFHPLYRNHSLVRVVDGLVHGMVERDAEVSLKKFVKYNLPEIVREILKKK